MKKSISVFIYWLLLTPVICFSQSENNIWCFGLKLGLDFNTNPPAFFETKMTTYEGCASVCNDNGQLLFYTSGAYVWDKNGDLMPNGQALMGNGPVSNWSSWFGNIGSSMAGVSIVKAPANKNQYYIITTDAQEDDRYHAFYSVVDMTLNGGLGDVVPSEKNKLLATNISEGSAIARSSDCSNYWLLLRGWTTGEFLAFKIDENGIDNTPIVSQRLPHPSDTIGVFAGKMKFNPQSDLLMAGIDLAHFDNYTGKLTWLPLPSITDGSRGSAFSKDGTKLYVLYNGGIVQFNLSLLPDLTAVDNSKTIVKAAASSGADNLDIRLASDGKLYTLQVNRKIGIITHPNEPGQNCQYIPDIISIPQYDTSYNNISLGFREFGNSNVISYPIDTFAQTVLDTSIYESDAITLQAGDDYLWYKWSTGATTSGITIDKDGIYWVYKFKNCELQIDTFIIKTRGDNCPFFLPNSFTPNADGKNDIFIPQNHCAGLHDFEMKIYNRYGQLIFTSSNVNFGWDGKRNGHLSDLGTYFYLIQYKNKHNELITKKGDVTLFK